MRTTRHAHTHARTPTLMREVLMPRLSRVPCHVVSATMLHSTLEASKHTSDLALSTEAWYASCCLFWAARLAVEVGGGGRGGGKGGGGHCNERRAGGGAGGGHAWQSREHTYRGDESRVGGASTSTAVSSITRAMSFTLPRLRMACTGQSQNGTLQSTPTTSIRVCTHTRHDRC